MNGPTPPPLDSERWSRIEELFHKAAELSGEERTQFLEHASGDDLELRRSVERFLSADAVGTALIDGSLEELAAPLLTGGDATGPTPELASGTRVGNYRILEVLGTGGMGTVYRAERADGTYERQVAIKTLRTGRLHPGAEVRFDGERRILARLKHPGIATLVDGGVTEDGQPFLVMELVDGSTIVEYAQSRELTVEGRVRLMIDVAEAVDYAHRNLVIHRDLKPANILVDENGAPKLLDFGIARLIEGEEESADVTRTALLLTPDYASPEQIRGEPVTTATDVYALGAVLYELLSQSRPFGQVSARWADLQRVLNETPPPLSRGEGLDRAWRRALDGDLETIVQKALHKEPSRRYPSARDFADDLKRHLDGHPVQARRDSFVYRASKLVSRNRLATTLAAAALAAIALGTAGTLWQAREARLEAERGQAVGDFLFSLFEGADPNVNPGDAITAVELLEAGAARVDSLEAGAETRVDLLRTLGSLFGRLGEFSRSETLLREAVQTAREELGLRDQALADALGELGIRLSESGDLEEAERVLAEALELRTRGRASVLSVASTQGSLAATLRNRGKYDDSATLYRTAIAALDDATGGDTLAFTSELMGLGQALQFQGRHEESEELFRLVRRVNQEAGDERPIIGYATHNLGVVVAVQGRLDEAKELHREALAIWERLFPRGHPEVSRSLESIARVVQEQGHWAEADSLYDEALRRWSPQYGDSLNYLATIRANQANLRYQQGNFDTAAEAYRDIVRVLRARGEAQALGVSLRNLGIIDTGRGAYAGADTLLAEALALRRELNGDLHVEVAETHSAIAQLRNAQGRYEEAETEARTSLAQHDDLEDLEHPNVLNTRLILGTALAGQSRWAEARDELEPVHEAFAATLNPSDARVGTSALWLGVALRASGESVGARALLETAVSILTESLPPGAPDLIRAEEELARLPG